EARRREAAETGEMLEHARYERPSLCRQPVGRDDVVEAVLVGVRVPEREVDVAAVACVLGPRLRGERSDQTVPSRDPADRPSQRQLLVGRLECRRVWRRDLVLAVAELGVVLLQADLLHFEGGREIVEVVLSGRRADRRETET